MRSVDPVSQGIGSDSEKPCGHNLGSAPFPGQECGTQFCVFHKGTNTQFCVPSIPQFAKPHNVLACKAVDFVTHFEQALSDSGLQQKEFAKACQYSPSFITDVLKRRRKPPLDDIGKWADALKLRGEERSTFIDAAHLDHSTDHVRALVAKLRSELAKAKRPLRGRGGN